MTNPSGLLICSPDYETVNLITFFIHYVTRILSSRDVAFFLSSLTLTWKGMKHQLNSLICFKGRILADGETGKLAEWQSERKLFHDSTDWEVLICQAVQFLRNRWQAVSWVILLFIETCFPGKINTELRSSEKLECNEEIKSEEKAPEKLFLELADNYKLAELTCLLYERGKPLLLRLQ